MNAILLVAGGLLLLISCTGTYLASRNAEQGAGASKALRQFAGAAGAAALGLAAWNMSVQGPLATRWFGPVRILQGELRSFAFVVGQAGAVDVLMADILPDADEQDFIKTTARLYLKICSEEGDKPCQGQRVMSGAAIHRSLPGGRAVISVFNYATNPTVTFRIRATYPGSA